MKPNVKQIQLSAELFEKFMISVGLDPSKDEHLKDTPVRFTKMLLERTSSYGKNMMITHDAIYDPEKVVKVTAFDAGSTDELIIVKDIDISSLCGHHLMPFFGKVHIGYLPDKCLLGLSKLARIADYFAKRPQTQEFLTAEILKELVELVAPRFAGVVIEATHTCMSCRGVHKMDSVTITSKFHTNDVLRDSSYDTTKKEFLSFIGRK